MDLSVAMTTGELMLGFLGWLDPSCNASQSRDSISPCPVIALVSSIAEIYNKLLGLVKQLFSLKL